MTPSNFSFRTILRAIAQKVLTPDWLGAPVARITPPGSYVAIQRLCALEKRFHARRSKFFATLTVLAGPFGGLRYPTETAHGSALFPKLLGVYESELHPALDRLRQRKYTDIVDVGFAEGYYLVGLAKWFPSARIWGFDINPDAHRLCLALAHANAIPESRMRLFHEASDQAVAHALGTRPLVVCDCEGFEASLFDASRIYRWGKSDLIIECHDFIVPGVTDAIVVALSPTHKVERIRSVDTSSKLSLLSASLKTRFSTQEQMQLVAEGRPAVQEWIVATPLGAEQP